MDLDRKRTILVGGTVLARWSDDQVLLQVDDGPSVSAVTPQDMCDVFDVGHRVCLVLSPADDVDLWWVDELDPEPAPSGRGLRARRPHAPVF